MSGKVAIIEDSSLLSRLDVLLLKLERFCALISGLTIFSLMFLTTDPSSYKYIDISVFLFVDHLTHISFDHSI